MRWSEGRLGGDLNALGIDFLHDCLGSNDVASLFFEVAVREVPCLVMHIRVALVIYSTSTSCEGLSSFCLSARVISALCTVGTAVCAC